MKLTTIKPNPDNPRKIDSAKLQKLISSVKDFPKMMKLRPIIVDQNKMILGGNMRYEALKQMQYKEIPDEWVKIADELTPDEKRRFIIADNVGFGDWDWEDLGENWDEMELGNWGLDIPIDTKIENIEDGEEIEFEQSVQIAPPMEYIVILAKPNSDEWEELKEKLKLKIVKRGGYKKGSPLQSVGIERVLYWDELLRRLC